jgi:hypothetical protein
MTTDIYSDFLTIASLEQELVHENDTGIFLS